jgi:hypothetical protein
VEFLAEQLDIGDASCVKKYVRRPQTPYEHAWEIRDRYGQGFAEYGRIDKTLHLLALLDPMDDGYLRRINRQLTVQESRHRLTRKICHGRKGELYHRCERGLEDPARSPRPGLERGRALELQVPGRDRRRTALPRRAGPR